MGLKIHIFVPYFFDVSNQTYPETDIRMGLAHYFSGKTVSHGEPLVGISNKHFFNFLKKPQSPNPYLKHFSKVKRSH